MPITNVENREFTTAMGVVLHLRPIPFLLLERLKNDETDRPRVPVVESTIAGTHTVQEENPQDPAYLEAVAAWERERGKRTIRFTLCEGVADSAPSEFIDRYREYFPAIDHMTTTQQRYLWLVSLLGNEELNELVTAIMGQTAVTAEAVKEAEAIFPGDGQRLADSDLPLRPGAGADRLQPANGAGAGPDRRRGALRGVAAHAGIAPVGDGGTPE